MLKEKCEKCGCVEFLKGFGRFQCLASMEDECFPITRTMNLYEGEIEEVESIPEEDKSDDDCECDNDREDDFPLYLEYEGLYGSSEMDNCTEMGGGEW